MSVNKVILVGNLGGKPELRYTDEKRSVCDFSIATNHAVKDKDGRSFTRTEWHNIVCFGRLAEICSNYLDKGKQIFVEGRIHSSKWKDKDGDDRYTHQVVANVIQFLGSKPKHSAEADSNSETFIAQPQDEVSDEIPW